MSEFKIESIPGSQEGIRILRLTGQFTLQHVFEFQSVFRSGPDPVTIIDLAGFLIWTQHRWVRLWARTYFPKGTSGSTRWWGLWSA